MTGSDFEAILDRRRVRNPDAPTNYKFKSYRERLNSMPTQSTVGRMSRPRTKVVDTSDPRGQLGVYLRHWIDKHHGGDLSRLAESLEVSTQAVRKWCEGESAPDLFKLDRLAKELGLTDWSKLAVAAVKFSAK